MPCILALLYFLLSAVACAGTGSQMHEPQFDYDALENRLERGRSTHAEVREALGDPTGSGSLLWPGDPAPRTLWFYQHNMVTRHEGKSEVQQDILLVFFQNNTFDGFLWYSDAYRVD